MSDINKNKYLKTRTEFVIYKMPLLIHLTVFLFLLEEFQCDDLVLNVIQNLSSTCVMHLDCSKFGQSYCSNGICVCQNDYYISDNKCVSCSSFHQSCLNTKCCKYSYVTSCIDGVCKCTNNPDETSLSFCWKQNQGNKNILSFAKLILGAILALSMAAMFGILKQLCNRPDVIESASHNFERNFAYQSYNSIQRYVMNKLKDRPPRYEDINKDGSTASSGSASSISIVSPIVNQSNLPSYQAYSESPTARIELSIPPPPYTPLADDSSKIYQNATGSGSSTTAYKYTQSSSFSTGLPSYSQYEILLSPKSMNEKYIKSEIASRRDSSTNIMNDVIEDETINHQCNNNDITKIFKSFELESEDSNERFINVNPILNVSNLESITIDDSSKILTSIKEISHPQSTLVPETTIRIESQQINSLFNDKSNVIIDVLDNNIYGPEIIGNLNLQTDIKSYEQEISSPIDINETEEDISQIISNMKHKTINNIRSVEIVNNNETNMNCVKQMTETHVDIEHVEKNNKSELLGIGEQLESWSNINKIPDDDKDVIREKCMNRNTETIDDSDNNNSEKILKHVSFKDESDFKDGQILSTNIDIDKGDSNLVKKVNSEGDSHIRSDHPLRKEKVHCKNIEKSEVINLREDLRAERFLENDDFISKEVNLNHFAIEDSVNDRMKNIENNRNLSKDLCSGASEILDDSKTRKISGNESINQKIDDTNLDQFLIQETVNDHVKIIENNDNMRENIKNISTDVNKISTDFKNIRDSAHSDHFSIGEISDVILDHFPIQESVNDHIKIIENNDNLRENIKSINTSPNKTSTDSKKNRDDLHPDNFPIGEKSDVILDHFLIKKRVNDHIKIIENVNNLGENIRNINTDTKEISSEYKELKGDFDLVDHSFFGESFEDNTRYTGKNIDSEKNIYSIITDSKANYDRQKCNISVDEILTKDTISEFGADYFSTGYNVVNNNDKIENNTIDFVEPHNDLGIIHHKNTTHKPPDITVNSYDEIKVPDNTRLLEKSNATLEKGNGELIRKEINHSDGDVFENGNENENIICDEKNENDSKLDSLVKKTHESCSETDDSDISKPPSYVSPPK